MKPLNKKQRELLAEKYDGKCAYCGCQLPSRWHADHIEPVVRIAEMYQDDFGQWRQRQTGGAEQLSNHIFDNMNPSCPSCNISKGRMTLETWREWIANHVNSLNLYSKNYRMCKAYGLVKETSQPVVFYFEKIKERPV